MADIEALTAKMKELYAEQKAKKAIYKEFDEALEAAKEKFVELLNDDTADTTAQDAAEAEVDKESRKHLYYFAFLEDKKAHAATTEAMKALAEAKKASPNDMADIEALTAKVKELNAEQKAKRAACAEFEKARDAANEKLVELMTDDAADKAAKDAAEAEMEAANTPFLYYNAHEEWHKKNDEWAEAMKALKDAKKAKA